MRDQFVVGRQPIFDIGLEVVAYKLVVAARESIGVECHLMTDGANLADGIEIDFRRYFGDTPVYVPVRPEAIAGYLAGPAHEQMILEVRASQCGTPGALEACHRLVNAGRRLCVDAGSAYQLPQPMIELASTVKFDTGLASRDLVSQAVRDLSRRGVTPVAKGVDSLKRLDALTELGFERFEGTALSQPVARMNEVLTPSRLTCLHLIEVVNDLATSAKDIERVVEREPGLSYRILQVAGAGTSGGLRRTVESISQAVVLMGRDTMYNWLIVMLMSDVSRGAPEQLTIAMTRARMCRLMATSAAPASVDAAYTVGLIAAMDLLFGTPLTQIVDNLALTEEVADAVLHHSGPLGDILDDVLAWETARFHGASLCTEIDLATTEGHYLEALEWAVELTSNGAQVSTLATAR